MITAITIYLWDKMDPPKSVSESVEVIVMLLFVFSLVVAIRQDLALIKYLTR